MNRGQATAWRPISVVGTRTDAPRTIQIDSLRASAPPFDQFDPDRQMNRLKPASRTLLGPGAIVDAATQVKANADAQATITGAGLEASSSVDATAPTTSPAAAPSTAPIDDPNGAVTPYATGFLTSQNKFQQRYGYFESRMKLPTADPKPRPDPNAEPPPTEAWNSTSWKPSRSWAPTDTTSPCTGTTTAPTTNTLATA